MNQASSISGANINNYFRSWHCLPCCKVCTHELLNEICLTYTHGVRAPDYGQDTPFHKFILNMRLPLQFPTVSSTLLIVKPILNRRSVRFHDNKLKFVNALLFCSFLEIEAITAFHYFTSICGRAYTSLDERGFPAL